MLMLRLRSQLFNDCCFCTNTINVASYVVECEQKISVYMYWSPI